MAKLIPEFYLPADFITKHSINIKRILQKSHSHRVQVTVTQEIVLWNTLLRKLDDWSHLHAFLININTLCMYKYGTVKNGTVKVHRYSLQSGHRFCVPNSRPQQQQSQAAQTVLNGWKPSWVCNLRYTKQVLNPQTHIPRRKYFMEVFNAEGYSQWLSWTLRQGVLMWN